MNIKFDRGIKIILSVLVCVCFVFTSIIAILVSDKMIVTIALIFSVVVSILFVIYMMIFDRYMKHLFAQLSDLIASITDKSEVEIFSVTEDTMLSKLQLQVIKLSKMLKAENNRVTKERNEIKGLVTDISHQLKTPIANLKMYSELLEDERISLTEREAFQKVIKESMQKLNFLVESMIKMSRLESGVIQLNIEESSLNETVLIAIKLVYQLATKKQISIQLDEVDQVVLKHDKKWTTECLVNILDNAIKYTQEKGNICVRIHSYEIFARIDITDTGMGITEAELTKIFKRFYRGTNATHIEGIGIGLYLSREIISKQGGYIKVTTNQQGSTFSVFLPL